MTRRGLWGFLLALCGAQEEPFPPPERPALEPAGYEPSVAAAPAQPEPQDYRVPWVERSACVWNERPPYVHLYYILQRAPRPRWAHAVYRNGLRQTEGVDYNLKGNMIVPIQEWSWTEDLVTADYWW